jgi:hypothetical protein
VFFGIPDIGQTAKLINPDFYAQSSEPFRIWRSNFTLIIDKQMANCVNAKRYKERFMVGVINAEANRRRKTKLVAGIAYCEWNSLVVTDIMRFLKAKSSPGGVIVPGLRYKGTHSVSSSASSRFRCRA